MINIKGDNGPIVESEDLSKSLRTTLYDSNGNKSSKKQRDIISSSQEGLLMMGKNDNSATFFRTDRKGNQMVGNYIPELQENFEGAVVNVQKWTSIVTTFAPSQATLTGYNFNPGNITTVNTGAILQSQRLFSKLSRVPLQAKWRKRHSMVSGSIADFGFGIPAALTTLIVPNGCAFRLTNSGTIQGVMTLNSVEIAIANVISKVSSNGNTINENLNMSNSYYTSNYFVYDLIVDDDNALFTIQDTSTGELIGMLSLPVPIGQAKMWGATALPVYERVYNSVAPSTAPIFVTTEMQVLSLDWRLTPDMSQIAGSLCLSAGRNPFTGAQTENHTNSTPSTQATLSNTTAGYTTLGGRFNFAAVVGSNTDYALFAFPVPAGSRFICEGIRIESMNTGAAVATTATTLEWAMGFNSAAVSLTTANIIRKQIGMQSFAVGAPVGTLANPLDIDFKTPEVVESGRFLQVILNLPIGTATGSQAIRGQVLIKGRFI